MFTTPFYTPDVPVIGVHAVIIANCKDAERRHTSGGTGRGSWTGLAGSQSMLLRPSLERRRGVRRDVANQPFLAETEHG